MIDIKNTQMLQGFRRVRGGDIPMLNARYVKFIHEKTGAALYYSDRDDGQMMFAVGFRTIPEDDTGVFHILEHSCLDGSEAYPLKEPFVNLIKTSMAVDLNAMTYEDRTVYYFASTNEKDYMNMMSVYLDAVFHPLLLSDRRIFEKEAWRLEPDGEGSVAISGVVFNEMQGNDNHPERALWMQMEKQLFPDLYYRFNSGGDPAAIPDLTYEAFRETYHRFYRPDNAVFYLSGKLEGDGVLAYIDRILSELSIPEGAPPAPIKPQKPVVSPDGVAYYQLGENEEPAHNTRLLLSFVLGDGSHSEEALAFCLLSRYLAENTESPLSAAVLGAEVGLDFTMGCETDCRQPLVYFMLGKSDPSCAEHFRRTVLDTLSRLCAKGLERDRLQALLDNHEVDCRRASLRVSTGFSIMEALIRAEVYHGDAVPVDDLAVLREKFAADPRYFESLIETWILKSDHWALTRCEPSRTLADERRTAMEARLTAESNHLRATSGAYEALEAHIEAFNAYLVAPDSPEAEASVPHLSPTDISPFVPGRDIAVGQASIGGETVTSLYYEAETNGIASAALLFDLGQLPDGDLFYVRCLQDALMSLPVAGATVPELTDRWVCLRTNVDLSLTPAVRGMDTDGCRMYLSVNLDAPEEQLAEAVALLGEYLTNAVFDSEILRRLFSSSAGVRHNLISRGNRSAICLAESCLSAAGVYYKHLTGSEAYRRLSALADRFDDCADDLVAGMTRVSRRLFTEVRPVAYITGSAKAHDIWQDAIRSLTVATAVSNVPACVRTLDARQNRALSIPGEVNYCAEAYALADIGATYSPRMQVVTSYLYSTYFWDEIRACGGAYGASASVYPYGMLAFSSYRDPRMTETYDVYDRLPDWLDEHIPDAETIGSLIVSTVGSSYFAPQGPIDEGTAALRRYLLGRTVTDRQQDMETILGTTPADFIAFADTVRRLKALGGIRTALGSGQALRDARLFESIEEL